LKEKVLAVAVPEAAVVAGIFVKRTKIKTDFA
jgi:hypothetical protein